MSRRMGFLVGRLDVGEGVARPQVSEPCPNSVSRFLTYVSGHAFIVQQDQRGTLGTPPLFNLSYTYVNSLFRRTEIYFLKFTERFRPTHDITATPLSHDSADMVKSAIQAKPFVARQSQ
jgi:hypothetical protein